MDRKKIKTEFRNDETNAQLKKLIVEENIIDMQKCYIYAKMNKYKTLYNNLKNAYKDLENENARLTDSNKATQADSNKATQADSNNKENVMNNNVEEEDSNDVTKDIKNIINNYNNRTQEISVGNIDLSTSVNKLKAQVVEKEQKIIELENTIIKLQLLSRSKNNKVDTPDSDNVEEIIDLKTRVEYNNIEKERYIVNANNKIMELTIKYEQLTKKYNLLSENYNASLEKIEILQNTMKEKNLYADNFKWSLENNVGDLRKEMNNLVETIDFLDEKFCILKKHCLLMNNQNYKLCNKIKTYKLLESKKNVKTGEDFYDEEITNLLQVCDDLAQENKTLEFCINKLEKTIDNYESEKQLLEFKVNKLMDKCKLNNAAQYIEEISKQKNKNAMIYNESKKLVEEKNRLIKLNIERIKIIDKYKHDLQTKSIEFVCQEKRNEEYERIFKDIKNKIYDRISSSSAEKQISNIILCSVCEINAKNTAITQCMHTFCSECIDMRVKLRDRKCPTCGCSFHLNDVRKVYL